MRKNTEQVESLLAGYIEGDLDARQRAAVERYLATNPEQRRMVQRMAEVRGLLRSLPREAAPADLREDVQAQLERGLLLGEPIDDEVEAAEMRINRWSQLRAAAAIAVLVGGVAAAIYWALPEDRQRPDAFAIAPVDVPRIEEGDPLHARREIEGLAGEMTRNRIAEPTSPPPPASSGVPEPASPPDADARPEPGREGEPPAIAAAAPLESSNPTWMPLRLDDPTLPDANLLEAARHDPLLDRAGVLAERNAADVLIMVRTTDPALASATAERYFRDNGIAAVSLSANDESRPARAARSAPAGPAEHDRSPPVGSPGEPTPPSPTTQPGQEADATPLAERIDREVEDAASRLEGDVAQDQVLLARGVTVQQAAELGKFVAAETARQGKAVRSAEIRLYARAPVELAEQFPRQSPRQSQLPAAQIDPGGPDGFRQQGQREEQQANEDDALRELAAGDVLIVSLPTPDGGGQELRVRIADDGSIELPSLGRVPAAGLTTTQLVELIQARLAELPQLPMQKAPGGVTVRRVPAPAVPRLRWQNPPSQDGQAASDRRDLLLVIRAESQPLPTTGPSTMPATDR